VKKANATNVTTLISKATEITGDIHFTGTLEIEGRIFGNIYADDDAAASVRVRETGLVKGDIQSPLIIINGLVEGNVYSSNHIELAAKARVTGNVHYHLIEMVMGSEVNGSLSHRSADELLPRHIAAKADASIAGQAYRPAGESLLEEYDPLAR
jgi:cytoskeletal protein CcmA (bactofilin family)